MVNKKPETINLMFDKIAKKYDFMNFVISFGLHKIIKKKFIENLQIEEGSTVLDLCTGTGDFAFELIKGKNVKVIGLDNSDNMLNIAKMKNNSHKISFIKGDCALLPFEDNSFDCVVMGFGLRNIENYENAIYEIKRVLKKGGTFAHIDIFKGGKIINRIYDFYVKMMAFFFKASENSYDYLIQSKNEFLSARELSKVVEKSGFVENSKKNYAFNLINGSIFLKEKN